MADYLPGALERLREHFRAAELDEFVDGFKCDIHLHSQPTSLASETQATGINGTTDGTDATYYLEIHLFAPSAHSSGAVTHIGEKKDAAYFERLLVHEYVAAVLDRITRAKPRGWRFHSAPRWFYDGYEEYLALVCSNEHSRTVTLPRYRAIVREDDDQVRNDFGLSVKNPYLGGAMLIAFMYDTFSAEKVHALLTSEERTFGLAVTSTFGVTLDSFYAAWEEWRKAEPDER